MQERFPRYRQQETELYVRHIETLGRNLFKDAFGLTLGTEEPNATNGRTIGRASREHLAALFFSFDLQDEGERKMQKNNLPNDLTISGIIVDPMTGSATITCRWNFQEESTGRSFNHLAVDALPITGEVVVRTGEKVLFRQQPPPLSVNSENPFLAAVRRGILAPQRGVEPITESD